MEQNSNKGFKIAIGVLAALLLGSIIFGTKLYSDQKSTALALADEKELMIKDLNEIKASYEDAQAENDVVNQDLSEAKERIVKYIDSLKAAKADVAYLSRFRRQVNQLKKERTQLLAEIETLKESNQLLTLERDSTALALAEQTEFNDSLLVQNLELAKVVEAGSALTSSGLRAEGIKVRSSGKLVSTERARRADKVRVCFSLSENKIAEAGDREFLIQVLDPNNNVIGENAMFTEGEDTLNYSKKTKVYYEQKTLDICDYVDPASGSEFANGRYVVNVYEGLRLVSQTEFTLK